MSFGRLWGTAEKRKLDAKFSYPGWWTLHFQPGEGTAGPLLGADPSFLASLLLLLLLLLLLTWRAPLLMLVVIFHSRQTLQTRPHSRVQSRVSVTDRRFHTTGCVCVCVCVCVCGCGVPGEGCVFFSGPLLRLPGNGNGW
uniref:Uncharacterized protein n=1 Tax=Anopheles coluzzii TaxID=1518534 RepID=A0A8W7NZN5_ANOCL